VDASIRTPRSDEFEELREIERRAGRLFIDVGLAEIADHEPESVEELAAYAAAGRTWVITEDDLPVGYALVDIVDGAKHLEQLTVRPHRGQRGLGRRLLSHICEWASAQQLPAVTLTTYRTVPWNAPFYARSGFRLMTESEIGPELNEVRAHETAQGLDPTQRVCMRRKT
jgi:predicted N-acetyltransferase YhbS